MPSADLMAVLINAHNKGNSYRVISSITGVPKTTIHRWFNKYNSLCKKDDSLDELTKKIENQNQTSIEQKKF